MSFLRTSSVVAVLALCACGGGDSVGPPSGGLNPCGTVVRAAAFWVTELAPDTIKTSLSKVVPHYMVPSQIIVKDALPLNPNGKIDRKLLDAYARTN